MSMMKEFKEFAMKGNMIDLAVGVVIGGAFGKIVTSLVNDMIMPPLNLLTKAAGLDDLKKASLKLIDPDTKAETLFLNYGAFLYSVVDFLIIAFAIFMMVKLINSMKKKAEATAPAPAPAEDVLLLREIRDSLAKNAPRRVE